MKVVTSIYYLMLKFSTPNEIGFIKGSQYDSRECYHQAIKGFRRKKSVKAEPSEEDSEALLTKPRGDIYAYYFIDEVEEECTPSTRSLILMLEDAPRIEVIKEVEEQDGDEICNLKLTEKSLKGGMSLC